VTTVLGVDVAARLRNIGVAHGTVEDGDVVVHAAVRGGSDALPGPGTGPTAQAAEIVGTWLAERMAGPVTVGLDAPLGWPDPLRAGLAAHVAGGSIAAPDDPDRLWRRATDQDVHARFGKLPLEVGANYIARAAWAGLEILRQARLRSGRELPVPLTPGTDAAIETYPAATLRSWLGDPGGYKSDPDLRAVLLDRLEAAAPVRIEPPARREAIASDHVFDAVICVVAAADFATGRTPPVPTALHQVARTEGWIHVR